MNNIQSVSTKPFLVIGHSHTTAISSALRRSPDDRFDIVNIATFFSTEKKLQKDLPEYITTLFQPKFIFCTFGGSEHNVFGLIEMPQPFDFFDPVDTSIDSSRALISYSMLRETMSARMKTGFMLLKKIKSLFDCNVAHICSPPPFEHFEDRHILPRVFHDKMQYGISPANFRRKLHTLHSSIVFNMCQELDVNFLGVPHNSMNSFGFLRPELMSKDPTHANAEYGDLVLQQLIEYTS
jgi:hypothetical protein